MVNSFDLHKVCEFSEDSEYKVCGGVSTYKNAYGLHYR